MRTKEHLEDLTGEVIGVGRLVCDLREEVRTLAALVRQLDRAVRASDMGLIKGMADRLVEMAMVQRGDSQEAVAHRSQGRLEVDSGPPSSGVADSQADFQAEEWPPPDCDTMEVL